MANYQSHFDSICSPYHNPNENHVDHIQGGINISIARLAYLQEKIRSHKPYQTDIFSSNDIFDSFPKIFVFVSTEKLTFKTSHEVTIHVQEVVFGCGFSTNQSFKFYKILGLGLGRSSLVSQLNSSFSYCIGSLHYSDYLRSKLILGHGVIIDEAISVDGRMLDINPNIFKRDDSGGRVIIDMEHISYSWPDELCYHGIMSHYLKGFPSVRFHFGGGSELALEKKSMFYQPRPDAFCMAVNPASINDRYINFSLIGMMAQHFTMWVMSYDNSGKQITFPRMDCELLDDD
ncbi:peptidase A1 domain-containing protein [Citrus sinensis]|uniref:Peptidase A1 domain-containing protein n=1 Tax=Citrus clementina TaxID=85681 RepID=V4TJ79_CITCL|nr:hypothetical protein CICLE_v10033344mg [Citrus x clementina]KAH9704218.1 peptidase A1 domain-containing protein [Citrus sinensis]